ncbi:hypothetical protein WI23_09640 [Burkholderia oklahomensis C6786]|nr:hypothetical protein WI23_09640 [Burkholderia oklahomensis C6786]KUY54755.1 hypothetical protein WI23_21950 [Burkholderia oklahomensis C6786]
MAASRLPSIDEAAWPSDACRPNCIAALFDALNLKPFSGYPADARPKRHSSPSPAPDVDCKRVAG